jgi:hypothetical protein
MGQRLPHQCALADVEPPLGLPIELEPTDHLRHFARLHPFANFIGSLAFLLYSGRSLPLLQQPPDCLLEQLDIALCALSARNKFCCLFPVRSDTVKSLKQRRQEQH